MLPTGPKRRGAECSDQAPKGFDAPVILTGIYSAPHVR